jgi:heme exporter protein A
VSAVSVRQVSKFYGAKTALEGVSLEMDPGAVLALIGPNGAGKSTLLQIVAGLLAPSEGEVRLFGEPLGDNLNARRRLGFMGHSSLLYAEFTAEENLRFYAELYGLADGAARGARWLEYFRLADAARYRVRAYSQGMRQRLALARALLHDPDLLLLDEPFAGLDDTSSEIVAGLLRDLRAAGRTVIVSTHQRAHLEPLAPQYFRLCEGRVA